MDAAAAAVKEVVPTAFGLEALAIFIVSECWSPHMVTSGGEILEYRGTITGSRNTNHNMLIPFPQPCPQPIALAYRGGEGEAMPRVSKERRRADEFRARAAEILDDPDWLDEGVRLWLEKQLRREPDYIYTENERAALARIIAAGTLFDGWDGYSVPELLNAACRYKADGDYEDELFLEEIDVGNVTQLRLREMGYLIALCRSVAGLVLTPLPSIVKFNDNE